MTDYSNAPLAFKARKVLRYLRIHGPSRTLAKVRGQAHLAAAFETLPEPGPRRPTGKHVGLVGCGNFAFSNIAFFLQKRFGRCIRGAMDLDANRAASLYRAYGLDYYTRDAAELFADPEIDLVYVASNHATHADYAIEALRAGKAVHVEKPHVASRAQLEALRAAMEAHDGRLRIGFNRPHSEIGRTIAAHLATQTGPSMLNWFVVGHPIARDHWYHDEKEGGRILGNLCHWTDFVLRLVPEEGRYPIRIVPTRASKPDCDLSVAFAFADESIATISFTAKGETFSGVRERFSAQRGDVLISMDDFHELIVERDGRRTRTRPLFVDQGHAASIHASYGMSKKGGGHPGEPADYVHATADLFLATREALEARAEVVLEAPRPLTVT